MLCDSNDMSWEIKVLWLAVFMQNTRSITSICRVSQGYERCEQSVLQKGNWRERINQLGQRCRTGYLSRHSF